MENLSSVESDWQAAAVWREPCDSFTTPSSLGGIRLWPRLESRAASLAVVVHSRLWLCIAGCGVHGTGLGSGLLARLRAAGGKHIWGSVQNHAQVIIYLLKEELNQSFLSNVPLCLSLHHCITWRWGPSKSRKVTADSMGTQRSCEKAGPVCVVVGFSSVLLSEPWQKELSCKLEFCWKCLIKNWI